MKFSSMEILAEKENFKDDGKKSIYIEAEAVLNTKVCKLWSIFIKLVRMLLVETSETCWYLTTFFR